MRPRPRHHRKRRKLFTATVIARTLYDGFIVLPLPVSVLAAVGFPGRLV